MSPTIWETFFRRRRTPSGKKERTTSRKFRVKIWNEPGAQMLTAEELATRVEQDAAKTHHLWFTGPDQLLEVIRQAGFDQHCARRILLCMIRCYTGLMNPEYSLFTDTYQAANDVLGWALSRYDDPEVDAAALEYFKRFAYRASRNVSCWLQLFGDFTGPLAQAHIDAWCEEQGRALFEGYIGAEDNQFSPSPSLMGRMQTKFAEEWDRMVESHEFDAENAVQNAEYAQMARHIIAAGRGDSDAEKVYAVLQALDETADDIIDTFQT